MEVLCVRDQFLSSESFRRAVEEELDDGPHTVRAVMWAGESPEDQHHLRALERFAEGLQTAASGNRFREEQY